MQRNILKEFGQLFQPVGREGSIGSLLSSLKDLTWENGGVPDLGERRKSRLSVELWLCQLCEH